MTKTAKKPKTGALLLKSLIQDHGYTYEAMANKTNIRQSDISNLANGKSTIGPRRAAKLAKALGLEDWRPLLTTQPDDAQ